MNFIINCEIYLFLPSYSCPGVLSGLRRRVDCLNKLRALRIFRKCILCSHSRPWMISTSKCPRLLSFPGRHSQSNYWRSCRLWNESLNLYRKSRGLLIWEIPHLLLGNYPIISQYIFIIIYIYLFILKPNFQTYLWAYLSSGPIGCGYWLGCGRY